MSKITVGLFLLTVLSQGLLTSAQFEEDAPILLEDDNEVTPPALPDKPKPGTWQVKEGNIVCIVLKVGVRITVKYTNVSDQETSATFDLVNDAYPSPENETYSNGTCGTGGTGPQTINVYFFENTWKLAVTFAADTSNNSYHISQMNLTYTLVEGKLPAPDVNGTVTGKASRSGMRELSTAFNRSYECETKLEFDFNDVHVVSVDMQTLQMEAFRSDNATTFHQSSTCPQDRVSNIVPIAVGAALGALVLIVLIAYLIGRRKSTRGYESV